MSELAVIVPTRGRPHNIVRLYDAWIETGAKADLIFTYDEDDPELPLYEGICREHVQSHPLERTTMVGSLNTIAVREARRYKYIGFMGDDHLPRTPQWDKTLCAALRKMGTGVAYGDDLMQRAALPTAVFMTSDIVKTLGYMAPPAMHHLYVDNVWRDWGQGIRKYEYLADVVIEHMHYQSGKSVEDEGYTRVNGGAMWEHDCEAYRVYCKEQEVADLDKLRALL